jgi:hypothetical protein
MRTQPRIKRVLFEPNKRLARDPVAEPAASRNCAKMRESRGNDISLIARIPLPERGIQIDKPPCFRIGHALLERFRDPGIIIFHDELGDLCPFARGEGL